MNEYKLKTGKIGNTVIGAYKAVEDTVVSGYQKIENAFVDAFLEKADDTAGEQAENPSPDPADFTI